MTVTNPLWSCVLLIAVVGFPASASSMVGVTAMAGTHGCAQFSVSSASCNVSSPVGSQTASASAAATATWQPTGSGILEATVNGFGSNTYASADASFSYSIVVTGSTGSGHLQMVFSGFQMNILNTPDGATVFPVNIGVGHFLTSVTLPNGAPQTFSLTAPITFGELNLFNVSLDAIANGTFFHDGTFALNSADGIIQFPTFVVTDANGAVLSNASVQFVPEPATWFFVALGLAALFPAHRSRKHRNA